MKRVLTIGAGRIAGLNEADPVRRKPATHAGMATATPGLSLAGVVDVDRDAAARLAGIFAAPFHHHDVDTALAQLRPDVVTIAAPYRAQAEIALRVLDHRDRPRQLLLEKPLAASLTDAERIIATAHARGVRVLVNNEVAAPIYRNLETALAERFAGGAISAAAWCSSGMHAVGVHLLGVLCRLFGRPAWVRAISETEPVESLAFSTNFTLDDPRIHAMIMFECGVSAFLTNSALTCYSFKEIEITCRTGRLRLSGNGTVLQAWSTATPGASTLSYALAPPEELAVDRSTAFAALGAYLASDDIDAGQDVVGAAAALRVYRLLDSLVASSRAGRDETFAEPTHKT